MSENPFTLEKVRRIVTGLTPEGLSTIAYEDAGHLRQVTDTIRIVELWATPTTAADSDGGNRAFSLEPDVGGTLVRFCEIQPRSAEFPDHEQNTGDGLHAMMTVDYILVLQGELILTLDDGEPTHLRAGDVVIQRGTVHAWSVEGDEPAIFFAVVVDDPELMRLVPGQEG